MDSLNIVQWNAQSILHHQHIFHKFILDNNIHIAIICETWLKPHHKFKINNYNTVRIDSGNTHNGVAILIHNSISYSSIKTFCDDSLQNAAIRIKYANAKELTIVSFYSPNNCNPPFSHIKFNNFIQSLPNPIFIAGDFNATHSAWGCLNSNRRGKDILDCINSNNLVLLNDGQMTTVGSHIWKANALDLTIVSPGIAMECDWSVHDDPLGSYHFPVLTKILITSNIYNTLLPDSIPIPYRYNSNKIDWTIYSTNVDLLLLNYVLHRQLPIDSYISFIEVLKSAFLKSCSQYHKSPKQPHKCNSTPYKTKRNPLPWWNIKCSTAVSESKIAYLKFKQDPTEQNYIEFKKLQAKKKLIIKQEKRASWERLCNSFNRTTPMTVIWNLMRKFNNTQSSGFSKNSDHFWVLDFLKKYTPDTVEPDLHYTLPLDYDCPQNPLLKPFTPTELNSAISSRRDTSAGFDGIPYKMLKHISSHAKSILLQIFNLIWENSLIPEDWKVDCLVPVLKPNKDSSHIDSYRPIALTSCIGKTFEQLLKQRLEHFIEKNNILPSNQFGFRRGKSSRESISHLHLDIFEAFKSNNTITAVFFDVISAFNNVNHHILSTVLATIGLPEKLIQWIFKWQKGVC